MSLVGRLLYIFGVFTLIPFIYSVVFETAYWSFLITTSLSLVLGTLLSYYGCESQSFSIRDGFLVVSSTWIFTVILGALPFLGSGILTNIFDALFEATSGITATGATIIYSVDDIPKTFVLWRGLMHWIGGMGIIVLILSFLKNLGADAAHFFNAEASVPKPGVVMPRIQSMASKLWRLYVAFTALCFVMLWAGGIEPFDALNYAFSIIATGGFAPTSAGAFIGELAAKKIGETVNLKVSSNGKEKNISIRIGVNSGSIEKEILEKYPNSKLNDKVNNICNSYRRDYILGVPGGIYDYKESAEEYNRFIKKYPDSPTTELLGYYLEEINLDKPENNDSEDLSKMIDEYIEKYFYLGSLENRKKGNLFSEQTNTLLKEFNKNKEEVINKLKTLNKEEANKFYEDYLESNNEILEKMNEQTKKGVSTYSGKKIDIQPILDQLNI